MYNIFGPDSSNTIFDTIFIAIATVISIMIAFREENSQVKEDDNIQDFQKIMTSCKVIRDGMR